MDYSSATAYIVIIPLATSVEFEDSLGIHWRIDKAIRKVKMQPDEPRAWKSLKTDRPNPTISVLNICLPHNLFIQVI